MNFLVPEVRSSGCGHYTVTFDCGLVSDYAQTQLFSPFGFSSISMQAMNLPRPNEKHVKEFQDLYLSKFGVELTDDEAWDAATRFHQLYYLGTYGLHTAGQENEGVERAYSPSS